MQGNRFSIFDALNKKGYFLSNPANADARSLTTGENLYKGPVQYPKMLYHPEGEERVTVPAEMLNTPFGPKTVGEQREMLNMIVSTAAEDKAAQAEGWHEHPAQAVRARVMAHIEASPNLSEKDKAKLLKSIPSIGSADKIRQLEDEIARLQALQATMAKEPGQEEAVSGGPTPEPNPLAPAKFAFQTGPAAPPPAT